MPTAALAHGVGPARPSKEPSLTRSICALLGCLLIASCASSNKGSNVIHVEQQARRYEIFVPPRPTAGMPLVLVLHGGGGTAEKVERNLRWNDLAAREGFVVAYPQGLDHHWNDGRAGRNTGVDDVAFLRTLIDELITRYALDRGRVFVTGVSNGGMMAYRLACDLADKVNAIAPVIGLLPAAIEPTCRPARPISVLAMNGTEDPIVPYQGADLKGRLLSAELSIKRFADLAGCGEPVTTDEPDHDADDGTTVRRFAYPCPSPLVIELLAIQGAGHTWPGGPQYLPKLLVGRVSREINATERIWKFFAERAPLSL